MRIFTHFDLLKSKIDKYRSEGLIHVFVVTHILLTCRQLLYNTSDLHDKDSGFNIYPQSVVGDKDFEYLASNSGIILGSYLGSSFVGIFQV